MSWKSGQRPARREPERILEMIDEYNESAANSRLSIPAISLKSLRRMMGKTIKPTRKEAAKVRYGAGGRRISPGWRRRPEIGLPSTAPASSYEKS